MPFCVIEFLIIIEQMPKYILNKNIIKAIIKDSLFLSANMRYKERIKKNILKAKKTKNSKLITFIKLFPDFILSLNKIVIILSNIKTIAELNNKGKSIIINHPFYIIDLIMSLRKANYT